MFKNRAVQVKMVKNADETGATQTESLAEKTAHASILAKTIGTEGVKIAVAYVTLDTVRKVLINRLSK